MRRADRRRRRVAVLLGGLSAEREVSEVSGRAVVLALRGLGYAVTPIEAGRDLADRLHDAHPDVVFNALHGRYGEDGCVQGLLEVAGIPYTGAGVLTSAIAMDKACSKTLWDAGGLSTPRWILVRDRRAPARLPMGLPVVVKPNCGGSSVGVTIVRKRTVLASAVRKAARFDPEVLIESYVPGAEVTVGILDGRSLGTLEIVAKGDFHSYEVKYTAGLEEFHLPARLPRATLTRIEKLAVDAHNALGGAFYSRVDLRVDGTRPYLIEMNTLPGLTALSYLPRIAVHAGVPFPALCERILDGATLGVQETRR